MNASAAPIPKRRLFSLWFLSRCLFFFVCVATLIALFYAEEDLRGKFIWDQYRNKMEALGEKFHLADFVPPPVPDEQNFAMAPFFEDTLIIFKEQNDSRTPEEQAHLERARKALRLNVDRSIEPSGVKPPTRFFWYAPTNTDLTAWQQYYRPIRVPDKKGKKNVVDEFPLPAQPQTPAQDILLALGSEDYALQKLREASLRPESRFPIDYGAGPDALLPHLAKLIPSGNYLQLLSTAQLAVGQTDQPAANVDLIFYLQNSIRSEPFLISYLVRLRIENQSLNVIWMGMVRHQWSDAQLEDFEEKLQAQDLLADFLRGVQGERGLGCDYLESMGSQSILTRFDSESPAVWLGPPVLVGAQSFYLRFAPRGWFEEMKRDYASLIQDKTIAAVHPETQRIDVKLADSFSTDARMGTNTAHNFILNRMIFNPNGVANFSCEPPVRGQTSLNLGSVACALERYWLANKNYPEHLEQLKPFFIMEIPVEITSGEPLSYQLTPNGRFKLSSSVKTLPHESKTDKNLTWSYPEN
jgi:hypothetical protein